MGLALHTADIANPAKPRQLSLAWTEMCMEEFFTQVTLTLTLTLTVTVTVTLTLTLILTLTLTRHDERAPAGLPRLGSPRPGSG